MADFMVIERTTRFVVRADGSGPVTPGTSTTRELVDDELDLTDRLNLAFVRSGLSSGPEALGDRSGSPVGSGSGHNEGPVMHGPLHSVGNQPHRGAAGASVRSASVRSSSSPSVASRRDESVESEALAVVSEMDERRHAAIVESLTRWAASMRPAGHLHRSIDVDDLAEPELIYATDQLDRLGVHDASRFVLAFGAARCTGLVEWVLGRDDVRDPAAVIASKLDLRTVAPKPTRRVARVHRAR